MAEIKIMSSSLWMYLPNLIISFARTLQPRLGVLLYENMLL